MKSIILYTHFFNKVPLTLIHFAVMDNLCLLSVKNNVCMHLHYYYRLNMFKSLKSNNHVSYLQKPACNLYTFNQTTSDLPSFYSYG